MWSGPELQWWFLGPFHGGNESWVLTSLHLWPLNWNCCWQNLFVYLYFQCTGICPELPKKYWTFLCWKFGRGDGISSSSAALFPVGIEGTGTVRLRNRERGEPRLDLTCWKWPSDCSWLSDVAPRRVCGPAGSGGVPAAAAAWQWAAFSEAACRCEKSTNTTSGIWTDVKLHR